MWQPIETAPTDEDFLAWSEGETVGMARLAISGEYCETVWWNDADQEYQDGTWIPTHWMPLPPPPETKS